MGLVHGVSVISPAGDDELLPGHVVPAGRLVTFDAAMASCPVDAWMLPSRWPAVR
jgi:hypothetical protein